MKQFVAVLLCLTLLLAGCGAASNGDTASQSPQATAQPTPTQQPLQKVGTVCPLTGLETESEGQRRPIAVMVNNADAANGRQWGIGSASVVVEALTEGKSTNRMLWFDGIDNVPKVGPVAPGKDLFWQFAMPMNSILVQKGMNTYADNLLNCYGWQPLDALMLGVNSFDYDNSDPAMPNEYNWYTHDAGLRFGIEHYGMPQVGQVPAWQCFATPVDGQPAAGITVQFSDVQSTTLRYENDAWSLYRTDGTQQLDANDGTPVQFTNVVVLSSQASVKDDKFTREYDLTEGEGLYLVNGTWQEITWKKGDVPDALKLYAKDGSQLILAAGKTYMAVYGGFAGQAITITDAEGATVYPAAPQEEPAE